MANHETSGGSTMPYWLKFFTEAGIPVGEATNYSMLFVDHRIQQSMLVDLNKEYLTDMGIKCMGDIIAILKQAKQVSSPSVIQESYVSKSDTNSQTTRRATAASRMVSAYIGNDPEARPMKEPPSMSLEPVISTTPVSDRGSVFARLGHSTGAKKSPASSIRLRLGVTDAGGSPNLKSPRKRSRTCDNGLAIAVLQGLRSDNENLINKKRGNVAVKRAATSTCPDSDDSDGSPGSPLPYAGVLKLTSDERTRRSVSAAATSKAVTSQPTATVAGFTETEGIFGRSSSLDKQSARHRLGAS